MVVCTIYCFFLGKRNNESWRGGQKARRRDQTAPNPLSTAVCGVYEKTLFRVEFAGYRFSLFTSFLFVGGVALILVSCSHLSADPVTSVDRQLPGEVMQIAFCRGKMGRERQDWNRK